MEIGRAELRTWLKLGLWWIQAALMLHDAWQMEPLPRHLRFRGCHNLDFIPDCSVDAFCLPFFLLGDQNSPGLIELVILERFKILADFHGFVL